MTKKLRRPLLKFEIEEAQENSISANAAARYLGVDIATYKKYAQFYGIYENLLNKRGVGVAKGYAKSQPHSTKLKDIFENKHPKYPLQRLKWRMIARGLINDECSLCGFGEGRITDDKKPLLLAYKEEHGNYDPKNLIILCYNCCFLTKNAPTVINRKHIKKSLSGERKAAPGRDQQLDPSMASSGIGLEPEGDLTDEEIKELREEIDKELGRG